jgi:transposase, IS605 OrfB family, central region
MKRTTKRYSLSLNQGKWEKLLKLARCYRAEKNTHLCYYNTKQNYVTDQSSFDQKKRNVHDKYKSSWGLQARQWKIVQKEAYETVDKFWASAAVKLKSLIGTHKGIWTDEELHYAFWLTYTGKRLAETCLGQAPVPPHFPVSYASRKRVRNYIRRVVRRDFKHRPVAHRARSITLDAEMYSLYERVVYTGNKNKPEEKAQFLSIMSLTPRERITIPLTGYSHFDGNIRLVLDFHKQWVEVHVCADLKQAKPLKGADVALDAGVTEVFTDQNGTAYEPTFGATLKAASDRQFKVGQRRNKLYALAKKSSKNKAQRIYKFNLGREKLRDKNRRSQVRVRQQISQAIREVAKTRKPAMVITEKLDLRGKGKSKNMSRLVSYWARGSLKERLGFLALVEGFHHKQVNPAYTSQMCPACRYVHKDNRHGDSFQCLNCGHGDHADRVAAINLCARASDLDITLNTPKEQVLSILQKRFAASLESAALTGTTVSGRTGKDLFAVPERNAVLNSALLM